ncbi:hypothetical protein JOM56_007380 [Amanita muscaria]
MGSKMVQGYMMWMCQSAFGPPLLTQLFMAFSLGQPDAGQKAARDPPSAKAEDTDFIDLSNIDSNKGQGPDGGEGHAALINSMRVHHRSHTKNSALNRLRLQKASLRVNKSRGIDIVLMGYVILCACAEIDPELGGYCYIPISYRAGDWRADWTSLVGFLQATSKALT